VTVRLFIAVQPPPSVIERLAGLRRRPRDGVRWTTADQWHVTLRFLGEVEGAEPVVEALAGAELPAAEAHLGPASTAFGRHVVAVPVAGLDELAGRVVAATAGFGAPAPKRPYRGHVTLARVRHGNPKALAGETIEVRWAVDEVRLVRSRLHPAGARYEDLYIRPLGASDRRTRRVLIVGPTSAPWAGIASEVESDLARLRRPGVDLSYRCTGAGPVSIRTNEDTAAAAPHVVRTVTDAAREGFDAVIVDCTDDPGVEEARTAVTIPVVGAGEALRAAVDSSPRPVRVLSGDELRSLTPAVLVDAARGAKTVALGGTGHSHLVAVLTAADPERTVLDPLDLALDLCIAVLERRGPRDTRGR
jgi:2'-5' RNA ligase